MGWQDNSSDNKNKGKKKNPWGNDSDRDHDRGPKGPWGSGNGGGSRGGGDNGGGPDIDEMLRRAQDNLRQVMPGDTGGVRFIILGLIILIAIWLSSGFFMIQPGEHGVVQRFGAWDRTKTEEGLGYRFPWPVESLTKVDVSQIRRMEIGFNEISNRTGQKQDIPEESLMLTSDANIVDLDLVVLWNIKSAEEYLFNIRDQENTVKKVAESAIREVVGQTDMFPIITRARDEVAQRARDIMVENLDQYQSGVNISQVLIQEAEVHPDVQNAF